MKRIDLNMSIPHFCADYVHCSVRVRVENVLYENARLKSIREVCGMQEEDLLGFRAWGRKSHTALRKALSECGLHLGMTDEELADYEQSWLKETKGDPWLKTINWEQRRWELVRELFIKASEKWWKPNPRDIIEIADVLINEYEQSLNTEERNDGNSNREIELAVLRP